MTINLTETEAAVLREFLRNHFHELQLEVARTESRTLRRDLHEQQDLVERLLRQLEGAAAPAA